jgi:hypothetical protein
MYRKLAYVGNNHNFVQSKNLVNNFISNPMKKIFVIALSIVFVSTVVSCKTGHTRCAAYGKINKIDTGKAFSNKTAKSL